MQQPSNVSVEMNQMARTVNTITQYAIDSWGISDSDNFRHLYQTICELDSNQVRITDFMWELMPTKAIRYWLRRNGHQTHVNKLEHHLKLKHHSLQLNLSAPSIYQSDATEVADRLTRFTNYERRINRLEDVTFAVELRTPISGSDAFTEAGKELKAAFNRTVNVAKQKLENWDPLEGLFAKWYHWLIAAASILLAIAGIILLWYCWPAVIICRDCIRSMRRRRRQWMIHRRVRQSERRLIELQPVIAAVQAELKSHETPRPPPPGKDDAEADATPRMPAWPHQVPTAPPDYKALQEASQRKDTSLYEYYPEINLFQVDSERERPYVTIEATANGHTIQSIADTGADANLGSSAFLETTKWHVTSIAQQLPFGAMAPLLQLQQAIRMSDGSITYVRGSVWGTLFKDGAEAKAHPIPVLPTDLPKPLILGAPSLAEFNKQLGFAKLRYTGKHWKLTYDSPEKGRIFKILTEHQRKTKDLESRHVTSPKELQSDMQTWKHRLYVAASTQGEDLTCRWDTGAPRSICKASTAYRLNLSKSTEKPPNVYYVNRGLLKITAVANAYIEVGHVTSKLSVLVVPDSYYTAAEDMLLGLDWTAGVAARCDLVFNLEDEKKHLSLDGVNVAYGQVDSSGYAHATRWRRRDVEYPQTAAVPRLKRTKSYEELNRKHEDLKKDHGRLRQQLEERGEQLKKQKQQNELDEAASTRELRKEVRKLIDEKKSAEREHARRLKQAREDLQQMEEQKDAEMRRTFERKELLQELEQAKRAFSNLLTEGTKLGKAGNIPRASDELMNRIYAMTRQWTTASEEPTSSGISDEERIKLQTLRAKQKELQECLLQEVQLKNALIKSNQQSKTEHKKALEHQQKQHQNKLDEEYENMRLLESSVRLFVTESSYQSDETQEGGSTDEPSELEQNWNHQAASQKPSIEIINNSGKTSTETYTRTFRRRKSGPEYELGVNVIWRNEEAVEATTSSASQSHIYSVHSTRPNLEVLMNINGHREACLFDTGCSITYLSKDILPLLLNRTATQRFHVPAPQNCPSKIVIGTDAMKKLAVNRKIIIDLEEAQILLDDETVEMIQPLAFINALVEDIQQQAEELPLIARVAAETIIPPRGDYHLEAHVEGNVNPNACYMTEERPHEYCAKVGKIFIHAPTASR
ncbi:hypothetical protein AAVH_09572 [Aphelenchoides avenae]|nr:hypothetical protein AAVH_09572 [Aphelenchus avenae]